MAEKRKRDSSDTHGSTEEILQRLIAFATAAVVAYGSSTEGDAINALGKLLNTIDMQKKPGGKRGRD